MADKKMKKLDDELANYTDVLGGAGGPKPTDQAKAPGLSGLLKTVRLLKGALAPINVPEEFRLRMKKAVHEEIASLCTAEQKKSALQAAVDLASAVSTSIRTTAKRAKELVLSVDLSGIIAEAIAVPRPATADVFAYSAEAVAEQEAVAVVADSEGELYEVPVEILSKYKVSKKRQKDLGLATVRSTLPKNIVLNINLGDHTETVKLAPPRPKGKQKA